MMNCERLKEEFCKLNEIDSLSFGEREMADYLMPILKKLGFEVYEDDAGIEYNGNCGNLYGILSGELPGEPILLSAHMDTVEPGRGKKAIFHEDGRITTSSNPKSLTIFSPTALLSTVIVNDCLPLGIR